VTRACVFLPHKKACELDWAQVLKLQKYSITLFVLFPRFPEDKQQFVPHNVCVCKKSNRDRVEGGPTPNIHTLSQTLVTTCPAVESLLPFRISFSFHLHPHRKNNNTLLPLPHTVWGVCVSSFYNLALRRGGIQPAPRGGHPFIFGILIIPRFLVLWASLPFLLFLSRKPK